MEVTFTIGVVTILRKGEKKHKIEKEQYFKKGKFKGTSGGELENYWYFKTVPYNKVDMWRLAGYCEELLPASIIGVDRFGARAVAYLCSAFSDYRRSKKFFPFTWEKERDKLGERLYGEDMSIPEKLRIPFNLPLYILDDVFTTGDTLIPLLQFLSFKKVDAILVLKNRSNPPVAKLYRVNIREIC